ncbi:hypothetical protein RJ640_012503 [Escallonia rubra]|uniref:La protein 1 n=1 Tax=Escallonia rubra TaxID=112253 RepID=A0AA88QSR4_9ASTE|nr:hypothetical protein RJ640_012503 [Escallonia rubra]
MASVVSLDEETVKKVIRQVEFYFSDSNLPRDKFLMSTISESEDGMISLALICSFSRMRTHLGLGDAKPEDVSEDTVKAVAETLRTSTFLKVSEDGKKIGRAKELPKPEEIIEQLDVRTIAASPLQYDSKLEDVESFFTQIAKVNSVRLPRHVADKRLFCGTALIEFSTEEDAAKILTQSLAYEGVELELKPKKDFDAERAKQAEEVDNSHSQAGPNSKNSPNSEANYPKGVLIAFKLKSISAGSQDSACENAVVHETNTALESPENHTEGCERNGSENVKDDEENLRENVEKANEEKVDEKTSLDSEEAEDGKKSIGSPMQKDDDKAACNRKTFAETYEDNMDVVVREDLKSLFQKFGSVKFVDFKMGADSGYIRFGDAEAAQKARASAVLAEEGGLLVKNYIATLDPVTGDAEKEYWSLLLGNQDKSRANWGRGGKFNRGGRRFNGKHSRSRDNDSGNRPSKIPKVGAA